jgi:hypothetical protein
MCDAGNGFSYSNCRKWVSDVKAVCEQGNNEHPMVVVTNKCDIGNMHEDTINISTKQETNIYVPLIAIARLITGDANLEFYI